MGEVGAHWKRGLASAEVRLSFGRVSGGIDGLGLCRMELMREQGCLGRCIGYRG